MFAGVEQVLINEYIANPVIHLPTHMHVWDVPCVELLMIQQWAIVG